MVKLTTLILTLFVVLSEPLMAQTTNTTALSAQTKRIVVLVPGFFNAFAPEYFSGAIVATLQNKGFAVVIAQKLNPIGTIEDNGERVLQLFKNLRTTAPNAEVSVIGHSAGGLYALYAINKGARYIKNLVTISTPFNGVEFVEKWREDISLFRELMNLCHLEGLKQLTSPYVQTFLKSVRIPASLKVMAYAGYQPVKLDITDAANMTTFLSITAAFTKGPSDGIVAFESALAPTFLNTIEKTVLKVNTDRASYIPLEHWEQVLDYRHFVILGVRNPELIRDRQIKFYSGIANVLLLL